MLLTLQSQSSMSSSVHLKKLWVSFYTCSPTTLEKTPWSAPGVAFPVHLWWHLLMHVFQFQIRSWTDSVWTCNRLCLVFQLELMAVWPVPCPVALSLNHANIVVLFANTKRGGNVMLCWMNNHCTKPWKSWKWKWAEKSKQAAQTLQSSQAAKALHWVKLWGWVKYEIKRLHNSSTWFWLCFWNPVPVNHSCQDSSPQLSHLKACRGFSESSQTLSKCLSLPSELIQLEIDFAQWFLSSECQFSSGFFYFQLAATSKTTFFCKMVT